MRIAVALLVVGLAMGCKRTKNGPVELTLSAVTVADQSGRGESAVSVKTVEGWVRAFIASNKRLVYKPNAQEPSPAARYVLKVSYGFGVQTKGKTERKAALVVARIVPMDRDEFPLGASVVAPLKAGAKPAEHVRRTVLHALEGIARQAELLLGRKAQALAALGTEQPDALKDAVRIVGHRKLQQAVPRLIVLLQHKDRAVADTALGALITIGDRRAVKPLTKLAKLRDSRRLAQVIDGVATLGGEEAVSFLDYLATGHANPTIRIMAKEALERMQRAKKASKAPP